MGWLNHFLVRWVGIRLIAADDPAYQPANFDVHRGPIANFLGFVVEYVTDGMKQFCLSRDAESIRLNALTCLYFINNFAYDRDKKNLFGLYQMQIDWQEWAARGTLALSLIEESKIAGAVDRYDYALREFVSDFAALQYGHKEWRKFWKPFYDNIGGPKQTLKMTALEHERRTVEFRLNTQPSVLTGDKKTQVAMPDPYWD